MNSLVNVNPVRGAGSGRGREIALFVLLTFGLSWAIWIGGWMASGKPTVTTSSVPMIVAIYAGSFMPGLAGALLSGGQGRAALRAYFAAFIRFRCGWRPYAVALLPLPLVILALTWALGYTPRPGASHGLPGVAFYLTLFPVSVFNGIATVFLGAGPLGEEGGWRGYLLPRMLGSMGDIPASIVVGVIWACWHLPIMAMFADWRGGVPFAVYLPLYIVGVIFVSIILTAIWRLGVAAWCRASGSMA